MSIGISQSNYFPWIGFFDLINRCDEFVLYDKEQFTKNDWRNRNILFFDGKARWLTLPVAVKNGLHTKINEVSIVDNFWAEKHFKKIENYYRKAPFFTHTIHDLRLILESTSKYSLLSDVNYETLNLLCRLLMIKTNLIRDYDYGNAIEKNAKLIEIIRSRNHGLYVSSMSAKSYLNMEMFAKQNIAIEYVSFQSSELFLTPRRAVTGQNLSIIDSLMYFGLSNVKIHLHQPSE